MLYGVGARLDHEPEMLFTLRGVEPAELIAAAVADVPTTRKSGRRRLLKTDDMSSVFGIDLDMGAALDGEQASRRTRRRQKPPTKKATKTRAAATRKKPGSRTSIEAALPGSGVLGRRYGNPSAFFIRLPWVWATSSPPSPCCQPVRPSPFASTPASRALLRRCASLRPGPLETPTASVKHTLRALARRWIALAEEIATHDPHLARLTTQTSPTLRASFGVGANTAAELLIVFGDNPERIRSEAAFAKLCGACPIPASSGRTTGRHRLYRGGHRQANAALYRSVIVRMRYHQPTVDYVARRTADGRTKREIIRCLKRFLAREIYQRVMTDFRARQDVTHAA